MYGEDARPLCWLALALALNALLAACESPSENNTDPLCPNCGPNAGGETGDFGPSFVCTTPPKPLAALETVSERVGTSAAQLLELANRQPQVSLAWPKRDSGPELMTESSVLNLAVSARGTANEVTCDGEGIPEMFRPKPHLELPVSVMLRSDDGYLAAQLDGTLSAESAERASIGPLTVPAEMLGVTLGSAVMGYYSSGTRTLVVELTFDAAGPAGWVGGPFGPNSPPGWVLGPFGRTATPCAYTTYAHWPSDATCWPLRPGEPSDDRDAMKPHLARVNQTFAWTWKDGKSTRATLTAQLADGETCGEYGQANHAVTLQIQTADRRADLSLPARLSGGPVSIDPWPAALRHIEPFTLDLTATVALDAAALEKQLGYAEPGVTAAIVSFYLSSPSGSDSPPLAGRLRVVPIDRSGFADPLPTVELPGGDSEHCFSASSAPREVLAADIRSEGFPADR